MAEAAVQTRPAAAPPGAHWVPPDERPVPNAEDPRLVGWGRAWKPFKAPSGQLPSASDVNERLRLVPQDRGGLAGKRPNSRGDEPRARLWRFWTQLAVREHSHAVACTRVQMMKAVDPSLRRMYDKELLEATKGKSLTRWIRQLEATGYARTYPCVDDTGRWWRTVVELFTEPQQDAQGAWHSHC